MLRILTILLTLLVGAGLNAATASGYEIVVGDSTELTASQYRDFVNELAFIASAPVVGPTRPAAAWSPWFHASHNLRFIRPADATWITSPTLTRDADRTVRIPMFSAGLGLPGDFVTSALYGYSPNLDLHLAGADVSYPFVKPTVTRPGLWVRASYVYPIGFEQLQMHLPAVSLYLTNEFLRVPLWDNRPLVLDIRAGVHQTLVWAIDSGLEGPDGEPRANVLGPAATQFLAGFGLTYSDWSLQASVSYASSQTFIDGRNRTRSGWNQSYRLTYHWPETK